MRRVTYLIDWSGLNRRMETHAAEAETARSPVNGAQETHPAPNNPP